MIRAERKVDSSMTRNSNYFYSYFISGRIISFIISKALLVNRTFVKSRFVICGIHFLLIERLAYKYLFKI